jgi:transaldolase
MNISVSVHEDVDLARTVKALALEGYGGPSRREFASREKYKWLRELGSSLWLDTGDADAAEQVWSSELDALTTNNTLVNQIVQTGMMDGLIVYAARKLRDLRPDISMPDLVIEIGFLLNAKLALSLVQKFGAHVSVELHPSVGFDVAKTLVFARRYYEINPDLFYVKVPLTPDGFIAARLLGEEKIPINFTLGFSARQNYLATLFSRPRFVNVFLGRLNQLVEENHLGKPENVGEKAAISSSELVRCTRETDRAIQTLQIAASMRNGEQVVTLAGIDVLTMPPKVAEDYLQLNINKSDISRHTSQELHVELDPIKPVETAELNHLWDIDASFVAFVEDAVSQANQIASGLDLIKLSEKHAVDLFHRWTDSERSKLREKGKIPDIYQWPGVPIDDLMSMSALESFAKDQTALDERILRLMSQ